MTTERDEEFHLRLGQVPEPSSTDPSPASRPFRDVVGRFATGVTVVTSYADGHPVGMTCQSFASVSLEPPLVLFCPAKTSRAWPFMRRAGFFCVNLLAEEQSAVSEVMATKGADKFAGLDWTPTRRTGAPLLSGVLAYVDCTVYAVHDAGDHHVVLGLVEDLGSGAGGAPLIRWRSHYTGLVPPG